MKACGDSRMFVCRYTLKNTGLKTTQYSRAG